MTAWIFNGSLDTGAHQTSHPRKIQDQLPSQISQPIIAAIGVQPTKANASGNRTGKRTGAGLVGKRLDEDKKSRSGSTQKSYFGMNLVTPFKKVWQRPGRASENVLCFEE